MISVLYILDQKGKVLISRDCRGDIPTANCTRHFIANVIDEEECNMKPVFVVDGMTYVHIKHHDVYFLAVGQSNLNVALVLMMLSKMIVVFKSYFNKVEEESIRDNFTVILELLDEMLDFGYPQSYEASALKSAVFQESKKMEKIKAIPPPTGAVSWRPDNPPPYYKQNQVFLDVVEEVNFIVQPSGNVISSEICGVVNMNCQLSGMPELRLGLNDKLVFERSGRNSTRSTGLRTVDLEDIKFHRCVRLSPFESDRTISFIPPDGPFELMSYRISKQMRPLFTVDVQSREFERSRAEIGIRITTNYKAKSQADDLRVLIPVPSDVDTPEVDVSLGKCEYLPEKDALCWSMKHVGGQRQLQLVAKMGLPTTKADEEKTRKRPPIQIHFEIPYFTLSGIQVRHLKVQERSNYHTHPWIRYMTRAGEYLIRQNEPKIIKKSA
ncbi:Adaptor protein complex 1 (AP-1), mu subunit [Monocercomonoides exilis]|uniref:Adaptor protein complex 1 (AP-1), mu subunit n=1 Tax=Monocercomonoides exilis TaxID=2049356 RepID=UPI003559435F|nr:Adaptor protein complex 1 (AP-1), mu subunit [Monocercomonoides exilis]|eukprot:MONOS_9308.1-p1 / transcript=MONOS_9308.1 / gene=MONOS_9308 / organism=Monocercomonoides_exilis_PA203 / gene_product= Adaptor protein complex 1 (AP-1), mu subunit / transcript_product= Adaptor protein complex 1 (AP-1), mu subunit / location=Mono_scaffold00379:23248-24793(-) / protein_length=439 / sequence_SO=supercontig / SO=protein_coding / is_pseudo=false